MKGELTIFTLSDLNRTSIILNKAKKKGLTLEGLLTLLDEAMLEEKKIREVVFKESENAPEDINSLSNEYVACDNIVDGQKCSHPLTYFSLKDGTPGTSLGEEYAKTSICWNCMDQKYYDDNDVEIL